MTVRRKWALPVAITLAVLAALGFVVATAGLVPMKASSGHWAVTRAFLDYAKNRSIKTQSMGIDVPDLSQPWQIEKGAAHFETGCRPCHGGPEVRNPRIAGAMLPNPPYLKERIPGRSPAELFYIVKHGLKFTGMPAWPASQRDDEVWAMVAFLLQLPTLDDTTYGRLADGDAATAVAVPVLTELGSVDSVPTIIRGSCARCHGLDGKGRSSAAFPKLAGQQQQYMLMALQAFKENARNSGIMGPIAAALTPEARAHVASYYSRLPSFSALPSSGGQASSALDASVNRGESIAHNGIPRTGVPSCRDCHGPGEHRRNAAYPNLAGQYADYLVLQLELFASGRRGGTAYSHLMRHVASRLSADEARDVAAYYESLGSRRNEKR